MTQDPATQERARVVQDRLEILWHKLEHEGAYVGANTVALAQEVILELTGIGPRSDRENSG